MFDALDSPSELEHHLLPLVGFVGALHALDNGGPPQAVEVRHEFIQLHHEAQEEGTLGSAQLHIEFARVGVHRLLSDSGLFDLGLVDAQGVCDCRAELLQLHIDHVINFIHEVAPIKDTQDNFSGEEGLSCTSKAAVHDSLSLDAPQADGLLENGAGNRITLLLACRRVCLGLGRLRLLFCRVIGCRACTAIRFCRHVSCSL